MWGPNIDDKHNARTRKRSRPMSHISTATLCAAPPGCSLVAAVPTGVAAAIQPSQSCEFSCIVQSSSFSGKKKKKRVWPVTLRRHRGEGLIFLRISL